MRTKLNRMVPFALLAAAMPALQAHPGAGPGGGFMGGLTHPFTGADHILAMLATGFWAAQAGRPRILPAAFAAAMVAGACAGFFSGPVPGLEQAVAASVLVLGLLIACAVRLPTAAGLGLVMLFAVFHGAAHGAEMPASASAIAYGGGFLAATASLLAAGVAGHSLACRLAPRVASLAGWAVAAAGLVLVVQF